MTSLTHEFNKLVDQLNDRVEEFLADNPKIAKHGRQVGIVNIADTVGNNVVDAKTNITIDQDAKLDFEYDMEKYMSEISALYSRQKAIVDRYNYITTSNPTADINALIAFYGKFSKNISNVRMRLQEDIIDKLSNSFYISILQSNDRIDQQTDDQPDDQPDDQTDDQPDGQTDDQQASRQTDDKSSDTDNRLDAIEHISIDNVDVQHATELIKSSSVSLANNIQAYPLFAAFWQRIIDDIFLNRKQLKPVMYVVLDMMEQAKDLVLDLGNLARYKHIHLENPQIMRFGMFPTTDMTDKNTIASNIMGRSASWNDKTIEKYLKSEKIGMVILYNISKNSTEYNIIRLINPSPEDMKTRPETGICKSIIDRFNIIRSSTLDAKKQYDRDYRIINEPASSFYVIETTNGKEFRFLSTWSSTNLQPRYKVVPLIRYLTTNNRPRRLDNYHLIQQQIAASVMFCRTPLTDATLQSIPDSPFGMLRNLLQTKISMLIAKELKLVDKQKSGDKVKASNGTRSDNKAKLDNTEDQIETISSSDVFTVLDSELLRTSIGNMLFTTFKQLTKKDPYFTGANFSEVFIGFLAEVTSVTNRIIKDLKDEYNSTKKQAASLVDVMNQLENSLTGILSNAIHSNVFQYVNYKRTILSV